uniref:hypothetical protein n=1 Tax=Dissulfurimicrobium sp. TaxID=2022436 RepID=UPI00404AB462
MGTMGGEIHFGFTGLVYLGWVFRNFPAWHNFYPLYAYPFFMYKVAQTGYPLILNIKIVNII